MTNKTSQKDYYDSFEDFDAIELGVVDGRENEYRKRFIARRAEKMAKIADLDDESTILEVGCGTGIYTNLSFKKKALPKKQNTFNTL